MFEVIGRRKQGYALQSQRTCNAVGDRVLALENAGDGLFVLEAAVHNDAVDEAYWYFSSSVFGSLHYLVENSQLYTLKGEELEDLLEVTKCHLKRERLLFYFWKLHLSVKEALGVMRSGRWTTLAADADRS